MCVCVCVCVYKKICLPTLFLYSKVMDFVVTMNSTAYPFSKI